VEKASVCQVTVYLGYTRPVVSLWEYERPEDLPQKVCPGEVKSGIFVDLSGFYLYFCQLFGHSLELEGIPGAIGLGDIIAW
jgi:hypothetical protein